MGLTKTKNSSTASQGQSQKPEIAPKKKQKRKRGHSLSPVDGEDVSMDVESMQEAKDALRDAIEESKEVEMDTATGAGAKKKKQKGDHGTGMDINSKGRLTKEGKDVDYLKLYQKGRKQKV